MINETDLILNDKGNIYHLDLHPDMIAPLCILVGDPGRVDTVSRLFDQTEFSVQHREFKTNAGRLNGKNIMVLSTGIGTDNIDIVINELDALVNIDFNTREIKSKLQSIQFVRLGTSGTIQEEVPVNEVLISRYAVGMDNIMDYYPAHREKFSVEWLNSIDPAIKELMYNTYLTACDQKLFDLLQEGFHSGITMTCAGFYGPQGRKLRLDNPVYDSLDEIALLNYASYKFSNFEMETAGIYGIAHALGHTAISFNAIIANRARAEFSKHPLKAVGDMIETVVEKLVS